MGQPAFRESAPAGVVAPMEFSVFDWSVSRLMCARAIGPGKRDRGGGKGRGKAYYAHAVEEQHERCHHHWQPDYVEPSAAGHSEITEKEAPRRRVGCLVQLTRFVLMAFTHSWCWQRLHRCRPASNRSSVPQTTHAYKPFSVIVSECLS